MNIEQAIKQQKFQNAYQRTTLNILFTSSWVQGRTNSALKPYDISMQQYNVLRILKGQTPKPVTLNMIQDRMLDKMSNASRLVEKLKQKGYVERQQCEHNRRQVDIKITEKGLELLQELNPIIDGLSLEYQARLSETEATQLSELLDKLRG